ncbi:MAG: flagellar biosynthetic protein FliR [bacterium]
MTDILIADFLTGLLIFLRIAATIMIAPIFSQNSVPGITKMFIAIMLTYILFFTIGDYRFDYNEGITALALFGVKEILTGVLIGFTLNFVFYGISFAGLLIGFDMGLSVAQMFDPMTESTTNIVGEIVVILATIIFLLINGHHHIINALAYSFKVIPIGTYVVNEKVYILLTKYSAMVFLIAVKIAAPLMVSFFLIHLATGIISRVIPQMNVFFVLQPAKIALGFLFLSLLSPLYVALIRDLLSQFEGSVLQLIKAMV